MAKLDDLKIKLLTELGAGHDSKNMLDLWDRYLIAKGYLLGTVLERQVKAAADAGVSLDIFQRGDFTLGDTFGPELATLAYSAYTFSGTGPPTGDANGIHWSGSNSLATAVHAAITVDSVEYEVTFEVFNYVAGGIRFIVGGETIDHGFTGTTRTANGVYTERGFTIGAPSSVQDQFRFQSTVTTTTASIRNISVRRVL